MHVGNERNDMGTFRGMKTAVLETEQMGKVAIVVGNKRKVFAKTDT
jgi:hypothetical protein